MQEQRAPTTLTTAILLALTAHLPPHPPPPPPPPPPARTPAWLTELTGGFQRISDDTEQWIKDSSNVFYAWHYGTVPDSVDNMLAIQDQWNVPSFATETGCDIFDAAAAANISHRCAFTSERVAMPPSPNPNPTPNPHPNGAVPTRMCSLITTPRVAVTGTTRVIATQDLRSATSPSLTRPLVAAFSDGEAATRPSVFEGRLVRGCLLLGGGCRGESSKCAWASCAYLLAARTRMASARGHRAPWDCVYRTARMRAVTWPIVLQTPS